MCRTIWVTILFVEIVISLALFLKIESIRALDEKSLIFAAHWDYYFPTQNLDPGD